MFDKVIHDERLEQLQRHDARQATLVQLELRSDHDDGAARVVHALTQKVLAEAALFALEHVRERLELPPVAARHGPAAPVVVYQRVNGLLQQSPLVVHDRLGGVDLDDPPQTVVAVDHAPVKVIEVRRREATTVELHHRAQLRRQDRKHRQHHPLGKVVRVAERLDDLQALDRTGAARASMLVDLLAELPRHLVEVHLCQQFADGLRTQSGTEDVTEVLTKLPPQHLDEVEQVAVVELTDELLHAEAVERLQALLEVLDAPHRGLLLVLDTLRELLLTANSRHSHKALVGDLLLLTLRRLLGRIGQVVLVGLAEALDGLFLIGTNLILLALNGRKNIRAPLVQPRVIHLGDDVGGEIHYLLKRPPRHVKQQAQRARDALEIPRMAYLRGQLYVTHPLAPHLRARYLNAAAVADDALELDLLVLAAVALPVTHRAEDTLAEQAIPLRTVGPVVDGLGLFDLTPRPRTDLLRGGQTNCYGLKVCGGDGQDCRLLYIVYPAAGHRGPRPYRYCSTPASGDRASADRRCLSLCPPCPRRAPRCSRPEPGPSSR